MQLVLGIERHFWRSELTCLTVHGKGVILALICNVQEPYGHKIIHKLQVAERSFCVFCIGDIVSACKYRSP